MIFKIGEIFNQGGTIRQGRRRRCTCRLSSSPTASDMRKSLAIHRCTQSRQLYKPCQFDARRKWAGTRRITSPFLLTKEEDGPARLFFFFLLFQCLTCYVLVCLYARPSCTTAKRNLAFDFYLLFFKVYVLSIKSSMVHSFVLVGEKKNKFLVSYCL